MNEQKQQYWRQKRYNHHIVLEAWTSVAYVLIYFLPPPILSTRGLCGGQIRLGYTCIETHTRIHTHKTQLASLVSAELSCEGDKTFNVARTWVTESEGNQHPSGRNCFFWFLRVSLFLEDHQIDQFLKTTNPHLMRIFFFFWSKDHKVRAFFLSEMSTHNSDTYN